MRHLKTVACFLLPLCVLAQEAEGQAHEAGDPMLMWKWVNFLILAAGLGYLIAKSASAFFRSRTEAIQKGISEAASLKRDAEARVAEIERKIANVGQEIEHLRATAKTEFASEGRRIEQETAQALQRIQQQAEQEISALSKHAHAQLKAHAAKLALDLAEHQVSSGMAPEIDRHLVDSYTRELGTQGKGIQA